MGCILNFLILGELKNLNYFPKLNRRVPLRSGTLTFNNCVLMPSIHPHNLVLI